MEKIEPIVKDSHSKEKKTIKSEMTIRIFKRWEKLLPENQK